MKKSVIKKENGAITLFVLLVCLFLVFILSGIYTANLNKLQTQEENIQQIKENYAKILERKDEIYQSMMIPNQYKVIFEYNNATGGNTIKSKKVMLEEKYGELPSPMRTYKITYEANGGIIDKTTDTSTYIFDGWYKEPEFVNLVTEDEIVSTSHNHTLYAKWTSGNITLETPTKQGYELEGWYSEESFENKIGEVGTEYKPTSDIKLYAKWKLSDNTTYKVAHYLMNTNGEYPETPTDIDNFKGTTFDEIILESLKRTTPEFNVEDGIYYVKGEVDGITTEKTNILADGSLEIKLYYARTYGTLTTIVGDNVKSITPNQNSITYYYGADIPIITAELTQEVGYQTIFKDWTETSSNSKFQTLINNPLQGLKWQYGSENIVIKASAVKQKIPNVTLNADVTKWTNGNVKVTASATTIPTGFRIETSTNGQNWITTNPITFEANGTMYARLTDGTSVGDTASYKVGNIDKTPPTIGSATATTATGNTQKITASNIADTGGSGLYGYTVNQSTNTPTSWTASTEKSFSWNVSVNGTYYVWVKDVAGNTTYKSVSVSGIVDKVTSATYSNASVLIGNTVTPKLTYSGRAKSITYSSSNTAIATVNSNGVVTGKSAGSVTITATITNYDGTTLSKTCTVTVNNGNVKIVSTGVHYKDLASAVSAATSGAELQVVQTYTDSSTVSISKNVTINTNGKTLTKTSSGITINSGYTVTLSGSGTLTTSSAFDLIKNAGTLNVTHTGTISQTNTGKYRTIYNTGTVNKTGSGTISSVGQNCTIYTSGTLKISSGTVSSKYYTCLDIFGGTTTINGGTVQLTNAQQSRHTMYICNSAQVNISSGTIKNSISVEFSHVMQVVDTAKVNISGGTLQCTGSKRNSVVIWAEGNSTVTISGSPYIYGQDTALNLQENSVTKISGGTIYGVYRTVHLFSESDSFHPSATVSGSAYLKSDKEITDDGTLYMETVFVSNRSTFNFYGGTIENTIGKTAVGVKTGGIWNKTGGTIKGTTWGI